MMSLAKNCFPGWKQQVGWTAGKLDPMWEIMALDPLVNKHRPMV